MRRRRYPLVRLQTIRRKRMLSGRHLLVVAGMVGLILSPAEAAARLSGQWKLNEELSPPLRAGSSPLAAAGQGGPQGSRRNGNGGRPQAYETQRMIEERNIRVRALYREIAVAPETLTLTVSVATAKFVDPLVKRRPNGTRGFDPGKAIPAIACPGGRLLNGPRQFLLSLAERLAAPSRRFRSNFGFIRRCRLHIRPGRRLPGFHREPGTPFLICPRDGLTPARGQLLTDVG